MNLRKRIVVRTCSLGLCAVPRKKTKSQMTWKTTRKTYTNF